MGTTRDKAGNRQSHKDHYCLMVLMWMFNPVIDSPRGIQQADERLVHKKSVEPDRCCPIDRGCQKYTLWNLTNADGSQYGYRLLDFGF